MEKELRIIRNRGHFSVPTITPQGTKIKTTKDKGRFLEAVDTEVVEMIKVVKESEEIHKKRTRRGQKQRPRIKTNKANQQARLQLPHND